MALDRFFDLDLSKEKLVRLVSEGEAAVAGSPHADNAAAAIFGGFIVIKSYKPLAITKVDPPEHLALCVAVPQIIVPERKTEIARSLIPKKVDLQAVVRNVGHASTLALGFAYGDIEKIGSAMSDSVVEPVRTKMIPSYSAVRENALSAGASGVAISGAGPSVIAVVNARDVDIDKVGRALKKGFQSGGIRSRIIQTAVGNGASVERTKL